MVSLLVILLSVVVFKSVVPLLMSQWDTSVVDVNSCCRVVVMLMMCGVYGVCSAADCGVPNVIDGWCSWHCRCVVVLSV